MKTWRDVLKQMIFNRLSPCFLKRETNDFLQKMGRFRWVMALTCYDDGNTVKMAK